MRLAKFGIGGLSGLLASGFGSGLMAGVALAQTPFPDQPITNLQNGISPTVAAVRREENESAAAAARVAKSHNEAATAIRGRLAEHDCTGAQSLAAQAQSASLSNEVETMCAPNPLASPLTPQLPPQ